jgi:hypothetical protein
MRIPTIMIRTKIAKCFILSPISPYGGIELIGKKTYSARLDCPAELRKMATNAARMTIVMTIPPYQYRAI